jgi:deoxyribonuclease V
MDDGGREVFAAADVHYLPLPGARAAAVIAADAAFSAVLAERTVLVRQVLPYQPGEFYLRELPPLRAVLAGVSGLGLLVIDGYVDLDPAGRPGLAAHAHAPFGFRSSAWPRPGSGRPATRWRSYAGARPGRCSSPRPGCRRPWPPAWSAGWPARSGSDALRRADALARTGQQHTIAGRPETR